MGMYVFVLACLVTSISGKFADFCHPKDSCFPDDSVINQFVNSLTNSRVVFPSNPSYKDIIIMRNLWRQGNPFVVILPNSTEDIKTTLAFAKKYNLRLTTRGTGHDYNGRSTLTDSLQLDLRDMKLRSVDLNSWRNPSGVITVGPGNTWIEVYKEVDRYRRVIVGGSAKTVGMGGYTLGGGHSPICRKHGMAIDNLLEVEMVMANGRVVTATKEFVHTIYNNGTSSNVSDADFFWAVAGGGGGTYGVATKFVFKLHMPPDKITRIFAAWPILLPPPSKTNIGQLVLNKIADVFFTTDLPEEWGGYISLSGNFDPNYNTTGAITLFLNHLGKNDTVSFAYMKTMIDYLPELRYLDIQEYNTFLEYEETVNEAYLYYYNFVYNSLLNKQDVMKNTVAEILLKHALTKPTYDSTGAFTGTLIGGKMRDVGVSETSVHPGFRDSFVSMSGGVAFDASGIATIFEKIKIGVARGNELAKHGHGMYPNEAQQFAENFQKDFWGINYNRLLVIKKREDPENFFTCDQCVGSEYGVNYSSTGRRHVPLNMTALSVFILLIVRSVFM